MFLNSVKLSILSALLLFSCSNEKHNLFCPVPISKPNKTDYSTLPEIEVKNSSELTSALDEAKNGGIIHVHPGEYGCLIIKEKLYKRSAPLLIKGVNSDSSTAIFNGNSCAHPINIINSSHIIIRGVSTKGGLDGIKVSGGKHIVLDSINVSSPRQAGIHIANNSSIVDIINSKIFNTGIENPQWGECIYVGTGGSDNFPDKTEYVWIENNEIHHCGNGEGINIKPEVFHSTARNNHIHHITPGTSNQYNQAAVTIEGARNNKPENNYEPQKPREIWIENNLIENIFLGRWANGIMVGGTGVYLIGNTIKETQENDIYVNKYGNLDLPVYLASNVTNDGSSHLKIKADSTVNIITDNLPTNPNKPQKWFCE